MTTEEVDHSDMEADSAAIGDISVENRKEKIRDPGRSDSNSETRLAIKVDFPEPCGPMMLPLFEGSSKKLSASSLTVPPSKRW
jgi:hypothetical protein